MAFRPSSAFTFGLSSTLPGGKDIYGTKPKVPKAIDYGPALKDAIATNRDILPSLTELGLMSTDALNQLIERLLPGATQLRDTITAGYESAAKGEISEDEKRQLERFNAELGISKYGVPNTQRGDFDLARMYGVNVFERAERGRQGGGAWYASLASKAYDPTKMSLSTADAVRRTEFNWNRDWLAAQVAAAPSPSKRGALDTELGIMGQITGAYAGAAPMQRYQPSYGNSGRNAPPASASSSGGMFGYGGYGEPEYNVGASVGDTAAAQEAFDWAFS